MCDKANLENNAMFLTAAKMKKCEMKLLIIMFMH